VSFVALADFRFPLGEARFFVLDDDLDEELCSDASSEPALTWKRNARKSVSCPHKHIILAGFAGKASYVAFWPTDWPEWNARAMLYSENQKRKTNRGETSNFEKPLLTHRACVGYLLDQGMW
jgi:hypothetical protein